MGEVYYYGAAGGPGHYLFGPRLAPVTPEAHLRVDCYGPDRRHIDSTLAPRRHRRSGATVWTGMAATRDARLDLSDASVEFPQGAFLRHELDSGFTVVAWWDRTQGDDRGGCNSIVLARGNHTSAEMLALLRAHFPTVVANLARAGVELVEVFP